MRLDSVEAGRACCAASARGAAARSASCRPWARCTRGHLELVRRAARENDRVCVSVFVNPLQFNDRLTWSATRGTSPATRGSRRGGLRHGLHRDPRRSSSPRARTRRAAIPPGRASGSRASSARATRGRRDDRRPPRDVVGPRARTSAPRTSSAASWRGTSCVALAAARPRSCAARGARVDGGARVVAQRAARGRRARGARVRVSVRSPGRRPPATRRTRDADALAGRPGASPSSIHGRGRVRGGPRPAAWTARAPTGARSGRRPRRGQGGRRAPPRQHGAVGDVRSSRRRSRAIARR